MIKFIFAILLCAQSLSAEILFDYERSLYFVSDSQNDSFSGVNILSTIEGGEKGFVFFTTPHGTVSSFHPDTMACDGCDAVFLTFSDNSSSKLYFANGRKVEVKGPIRFTFAAFEVYFDPRAPQRFTSIVTRNNTEVSITAFSNLENIINQNDSKEKNLVSLLLPKAPEDFQFKDRSIFSKGNEFLGESIGVNIGSRNPCLLSDSVIVSEEDAISLRENKSLSEGAKKSFAALRKGEYVNSLENDYILLSITDESLVVVEPKNISSLSLISPLGASGYESVCVVKKL